MGWESSGVVGFDCGGICMLTVDFQRDYDCLLLVLEVWDGKPTYRKSWAGNLLVWSDLTLGSSFKVK